jgi:hypothetical protein
MRPCFTEERCHEQVTICLLRNIQPGAGIAYGTSPEQFLYFIANLCFIPVDSYFITSIHGLLKFTFMNFQTMSKQRKFVLIAASIGFISMFLPWISVSVFGYTESRNGIHDIGILAFLGFVVSAIIAFMGDQTKNLDKNTWGIVLVAGTLSLLSAVWFYFKASDSILGSSFVGYGLYIAGIAAIGVVGSAYLFRSPTDNIKDSFNSMKKNIEDKMGNSAASTPPPPPPSSGSIYQDSNNLKPPASL